jgi:hypothetical protein
MALQMGPKGPPNAPLPAMGVVSRSCEGRNQMRKIEISLNQ